MPPKVERHSFAEIHIAETGKGALSEHMTTDRVEDVIESEKLPERDTRADVLYIDAALTYLESLEGDGAQAAGLEIGKPVETLHKKQIALEQRLTKALAERIDVIAELATPNPADTESLGAIFVYSSVLAEISSEVGEGKGFNEARMGVLEKYNALRQEYVDSAINQLTHAVRIEGFEATWEAVPIFVNNREADGDLEISATLRKYQADLGRLLVARKFGGNAYAMGVAERLQATQDVLAELSVPATKFQWAENQREAVLEYAAETGDIAELGESDIAELVTQLTSGETIRATEIAFGQTQEQILSPETVKSTENIVYTPEAAVFGDLHGDIRLPGSGEMGVYCGDVLDFKPAAYRNIEVRDRFEQGLTEFMDSVERGDNIFILGNHEIKFMYYMMLEENLEALQNAGAATEVIERAEKAVTRVFQNWVIDGGEEVMLTLGIVNMGDRMSIEEARQRVKQNEALKRFQDICRTHGKTYAVVNETFIAHTLPLIDAEGSPAEVLNGLTGIDALDYIQEKIREGDLGLMERLYVTQWKTRDEQGNVLATHEGGPFWNRGIEVDRVFGSSGNQIAARLVGALDAQIKQRQPDARIKKIAFGHIASGGNQTENGIVSNIDYAGKSREPKPAKSTWESTTGDTTFEL